MELSVRIKKETTQNSIPVLYNKMSMAIGDLGYLGFDIK